MTSEDLITPCINKNEEVILQPCYSQLFPVPTPRTKRKTELENAAKMMNASGNNNNNHQPCYLHQNTRFLSRFQNGSQDSGLSQSPNNYQPAPPLPPKKKSVSPPGGPSHNIFQPSLLVRNPNSNVNGWKRHQQRSRIEAQRNSILSSDEDEEELRLRRLAASEAMIMNEPFPAELDFAQVIGKPRFNSSQPPPPPPRDPRRRLYLSPGPGGQPLGGCSRPVSYSFEKQPDVVQKSSQDSARLSRPLQRVEEAERLQGRAASASSYFVMSQSVPDLVRPMEYWKSPPPPYVPTYDPYIPSGPDPYGQAAPPRPPRPNLRKKLR